MNSIRKIKQGTIKEYMIINMESSFQNDNICNICGESLVSYETKNIEKNLMGDYIDVFLEEENEELCLCPFCFLLNIFINNYNYKSIGSNISEKEEYVYKIFDKQILNFFVRSILCQNNIKINNKIKNNALINLKHILWKEFLDIYALKDLDNYENLMNYIIKQRFTDIATEHIIKKEDFTFLRYCALFFETILNCA